MVDFINYNEYTYNVIRTGNGHWTARGLNYADRWPYHQIAIDIIRSLRIDDPSGVLEIGALGATLVKGSDTLDFDNDEFRITGYNDQPTIKHDLRIIPWPVEKHYRLIIALRVWHHLKPVEREAFLEAKRIADNVLIVCPEVNVRGR
ncbi:MAG: hypothetical protein WC374_10910, partial [Phycisphaerae bacterium]